MKEKATGNVDFIEIKSIYAYDYEIQKRTQEHNYLQLTF